jgi:hypothetical protein
MNGNMVCLIESILHFFTYSLMWCFYMHTYRSHPSINACMPLIVFSCVCILHDRCALIGWMDQMHIKEEVSGDLVCKQGCRCNNDANQLHVCVYIPMFIDCDHHVVQVTIIL